MIKKQQVKKDKTVKVTFVIAGDDVRLPAAVLGDFNEWDPVAHPFKKRSNGTQSVTAVLPQGKKYCFRYRSADGLWFNEDEADGFEMSDVGSENCFLKT